MIADLKAARRTAGWTQEAIGARIGVDAQTVKRLEKGVGSVANLDMLMEADACPADHERPRAGRRFAAFRALVEALPKGMASSDIAAAISTTPNTMSAHLAILERAGLVSSEKHGRSVVYRAETGPTGGLSEFLTQACQQGRKERSLNAAD